jgi:hypothetical protein
MSSVRNYQQYDCLPIGILNYQILRTWKKVFYVLLEELHISVKAFPSQRIGGGRFILITHYEFRNFEFFSAHTT